MADFNLIRNKSIALLVWHTVRENDVQVFRGEIIQKDDEFYFVNESQNWNVHLDEEKLDELREVTEDVKKILLHADLCLSLTIAPLPDDAKTGYFPTGMKWQK
jgi:hypothetical protein